MTHVSATLLVACLTAAPVAFAQEPAPRTSIDLPAGLDTGTTSPDSAATAPAPDSAATAPADAAVATPSPAATPSDTPPTVTVARPVAAAVPTPIDLATAYQIGPEDVLEISVWKNPELSRTVPVRPDGKVSLPLV